MQRTQQALRAALVELIAEQGYEGISVQEIADRANVGRGTFYLHYPDKEHLMLDTLEHVFAQVTSQLAPLAHADVAGASATASLVVFQHVGQHAALYRSLLSERSAAMIASRIRRDLAQFVAGQLSTQLGTSAPTDAPVDALAEHVAGALVALITWWLEHEMPYPAEHMAALHHRLIVQGLANITVAVVPETHPEPVPDHDASQA